MRVRRRFINSEGKQSIGLATSRRMVREEREEMVVGREGRRLCDMLRVRRSVRREISSGRMQI